MLSEKEIKQKACHKRTTTWLIRIIAAAIAFFLLTLLARGIKTQEIELKKAGGSYDGELVITRDSSDNLLITTPAGTILMKDGKLTLSAGMIIDGLTIGTTSQPSILTLSPYTLTVSQSIYFSHNLIGGGSGQDGFFLLKRADNSYFVNADVSLNIFDLECNLQARDVWFEYGLNVGNTSGATIGQGKFTADLLATDATLSAPVNIYLLSHDSFANFVANEHTNWTSATQSFSTSSTGHFGGNLDTDSDNITDGFSSTDGNELLACDLIRHTIDAAEAGIGEFQVEWETTTIAKLVSISTSLTDGGSFFKNESNAGMDATYDGSEISVFEGTVQWQEDEVVSILLFYQK